MNQPMIDYNKQRKTLEQKILQLLDQSEITTDLYWHHKAHHKPSGIQIYSNHKNPYKYPYTCKIVIPDEDTLEFVSKEIKEHIQSESNKTQKQTKLNELTKTIQHVNKALKDTQ